MNINFHKIVQIYNSVIYNITNTYTMKPVNLNPSLQLLEEAVVNQPVTAELTLLNPLPEPLQDCSFTIEGVGLTSSKPITAKYVNSIPSVMSRFMLHLLLFSTFLWFPCVTQLPYQFIYNLMDNIVFNLTFNCL